MSVRSHNRSTRSNKLLRNRVLRKQSLHSLPSRHYRNLRFDNSHHNNDTAKGNKLVNRLRYTRDSRIQLRQKRIAPVGKIQRFKRWILQNLISWFNNLENHNNQSNNSNNANISYIENTENITSTNSGTSNNNSSRNGKYQDKATQSNEQYDDTKSSIDTTLEYMTIGSTNKDLLRENTNRDDTGTLDEAVNIKQNNKSKNIHKQCELKEIELLKEIALLKKKLQYSKEKNTLYKSMLDDANINTKFMKSRRHIHNLVKENVKPQDKLPPSPERKLQPLLTSSPIRLGHSFPVSSSNQVNSAHPPSQTSTSSNNHTNNENTAATSNDISDNTNSRKKHISAFSTTTDSHKITDPTDSKSIATPPQLKKFDYNKYSTLPTTESLKKQDFQD